MDISLRVHRIFFVFDATIPNRPSVLGGGFGGWRPAWPVRQDVSTGAGGLPPGHAGGGGWRLLALRRPRAGVLARPREDLSPTLIYSDPRLLHPLVAYVIVLGVRTDGSGGWA